MYCIDKEKKIYMHFNFYGQTKKNVYQFCLIPNQENFQCNWITLPSIVLKLAS